MRVWKAREPEALLGRVSRDLGGLGEWGWWCCEGLRKVWEENGGGWVGAKSKGCDGGLVGVGE